MIFCNKSYLINSTLLYLRTKQTTYIMKKRILTLLVIVSVLFTGCKETKKKSEPQKPQEQKEQKDYKTIGLKYALNTKAVLGRNLTGQLKKNGAVAALSFCNERAYHLTDSMANVQKVKIKRVSDKHRNPKNKANNKELEYIKQFKEALAKGESISPIFDKKDGKVHFYAPIITNDMCLKCHGTPNKQIKTKTLKKIKELYPEDNATGYGAGQVRGIWSIVFDE